MVVIVRDVIEWVVKRLLSVGWASDLLGLSLLGSLCSYRPVMLPIVGLIAFIGGSYRYRGIVLCLCFCSGALYRLYI